MNILKTKNLTKNFGSLCAVNDVSINIESGKIYGLLGPNGSGKSSLMKLVVGLLHAKSGDISILGEDISYRTKAYIAYMPTENYFFKYMTINQAKNYYKDFFLDFDTEKFSQLLSFMQLNESMTISSLSSGMSAKLRVVLTMSRRAKLYMLDEPLNGIDLVARDAILSTIIKEINNDNAIIISSHLIETIENVIDDCIFIKNGKIALCDNAESAREKHGKSITDLYREVFAL